ncbi:MAG: GNAT family N-acetyltransferase, partial [Chloroflexota bacterium]
MSIRPLNLPSDFNVLTELIVDSFQYPENESWSVGTDDQENIQDMFTGVQRIWPLLRLVQFFSPALRDVLHGYFWEHEGLPVGMIVMQRQNKTNTWRIGNVAVLPAFRRQGIARKLVAAALDFIRERGGEMALLDVISGNIPAYSLYEQMGFVHYNSRHEFEYLGETPLTEPPILEGYVVSKLKPLAWRPRFELSKEITPKDIQQYEPVTEAHYNPGVMMPLSLLVMKVSGMKMQRVVIHTIDDGKTAAFGLYQVRKRAGGVNGIALRVNPDHPDLAGYLLPFLLNTATRLSPGRRIEFSVPYWQERVLEAVSHTPCVKKYEYHSMG